ncbi:MAG: hypothetical protein ACRDNB_13415 [Gaiellaceae bacterium]
MAVGDTLSEIFRLWGRTAAPVAAAALVVVLPLEVLIAVFDPANDVSPNAGLYVALFSGTNLVALPWVAGAVVRYLHDGGSALAAYGKLEGALAGLIVGSFLAFLGIVAGLVLLVVPGLIVASRWSVLVPAAVIERRGPIEALSRSNDAVRGATGRVLAIMSAATVAAFALVLVPAAIAEVFSPGFVASLVLGLSVDLLGIPLMATAAYVVYRRRAETA